MNKKWQQVKIIDFCTIKRGGSPRPINDFVTKSDSGVPWLKIGDIDQQSKYIYGTTEKIRQDGVSKSTLVHPGDFILSNSMSFGRPYIMKISACIHDGWLTLQDINKDIVIDIYLFYLLLHPKTQSEFASLSAGSGVKNLKKETVEQVSLLLPPLSEQHKIVEILETWDGYLDKMDALITSKRELKKALMRELLTGKRRLPGFEGEWKEVKLGEVLTNKSMKYTPNKEDSLKCIELEHIDQGTGKLLGSVSSQEVKSTKNYFKSNSILFGKLRPYLKKYYLTEFEGVCSSEIWVLTVNKHSSINFFYHFIQAKRFIDAADKSSGSRMPRADWKVVSELVLNLPPLPEQTAIAEILSTADQELQTLEAKRQAIADQRKYLLEHLVTGKIRVEGL